PLHSAPVPRGSQTDASVTAPRTGRSPSRFSSRRVSEWRASFLTSRFFMVVLLVPGAEGFRYAGDGKFLRRRWTVHSRLNSHSPRSVYEIRTRRDDHAAGQTPHRGSRAPRHARLPARREPRGKPRRGRSARRRTRALAGPRPGRGLSVRR